MLGITRLDARLDTSLESLLGRLPRDPGPTVLATVVATAGSTYRKPGARMLFRPDGGCHGLLSGGCLEADLALHAQKVMQGGIACAVEYDMRGPDDGLFGIGAGCEGAMRVLLEPAGPGSLAAAALAHAAHETGMSRAASLVSVHESTHLTLGTYAAGELPSAELEAAAARALEERRNQAIHGDSGARRTRAFVQFLAPPPHLLICGAGADARPVVSTAVALGWRVSVMDHRPAYLTPDGFPGATVHLADPRDLRSVVALEQCHAAVVMSHHLNSDVAYLRELAQADGPAYVGLLGPLGRRRRIARELGDANEALRSRLRGPVGSDIGAVTPEGIALSIISQVHGWLARRA